MELMEQAIPKLERDIAVVRCDKSGKVFIHYSGCKLQGCRRRSKPDMA